MGRLSSIVEFRRACRWIKASHANHLKLGITPAESKMALSNFIRTGALAALRKKHRAWLRAKVEMLAPPIEV